jgi:hypothetical protein
LFFFLFPQIKIYFTAIIIIFNFPHFIFSL